MSWKDEEFERWLDEALRPECEPPQGLEERVIARLRASRVASRRRVVPLLAAAAALLVVLSGTWLMRRLPGRPVPHTVCAVHLSPQETEGSDGRRTVAQGARRMVRRSSVRRDSGAGTLRAGPAVEVHPIRVSEIPVGELSVKPIEIGTLGGGFKE
jgi:hypothetical protein